MSQIRVVLADDHPVVRSGIRTLLRGAEDIAVVGEAETGAEALKLVSALRPDVLLLDINLPDISGTEVARRLAVEGTSVHVLGLSAFDDEEDIEDLLDAGATGYLIKDEAPGKIIEAVRGVALGEEGHFSRSVTAKLIRSKRKLPPRQTSGKALSLRERQILELVATGNDKADIADRLCVAEGTVKNHVTDLYSKTGTRTMQKLMAWAQEQGYAGKRGMDSQGRDPKP